jgi:hypothetical protein
MKRIQHYTAEATKRHAYPFQFVEFDENDSLFRIQMPPDKFPDIGRESDNNGQTLRCEGYRFCHDVS